MIYDQGIGAIDLTEQESLAAMQDKKWTKVSAIIYYL